MCNDVVVINIREFLSNNDAVLGEEELKQILSDFSCPKNVDVERFLKENAIEFTKKNQSVTYLVFSEADAELVGYFTLAVKPISINVKGFSHTLIRKIARVSELDKETSTYTLSAYLIAQLGKNFKNSANAKITGKQLLHIAVETIENLQYLAGGMVMFLEAEDNERLLRFYEIENGFKKFALRDSNGDCNDKHELVQLLKII